MIKYISALTLFFTGALSISAQGLSYSFADFEKQGFREVHETTLGSKDGAFDIMRIKYNALGEPTIYADHFSANNLMRSYSIEIFKKDLYKSNAIPHKIYFENAFLLDSTLIVLFSSPNTEKLENVLYAIQYVDGYKIGNPTEVARIKMPNRYERGKFVIHPDKELNVFVTIGTEAGEKYKDGTFKISTYDQQLNDIWKQNLTIPYHENRYELMQTELDENKRIFLLFKIILTNDQQKKQNLPISDYYYSLLQLSQTQDEDYLETTLNMDNKSIFNMFINLKDEPGKILLSGLYSNKRNDLKPKGVYFAKMDKDSTTPGIIKIQSVEEDFISDFQFESPFEDHPDQEPEIEIVDLIQSPQGTYYLLSEYTLINETCIPDFRTALMSCTYNFYYNEIFVFKFDSAGSLQGKYKIPKRQFTKNDEGIYSSFAYGFIKDKLVLLYNDHPKNIRPKNPENLRFMTDPKKSTLAAVTIDSQGNISKDFLVNNDKRKAWCKPKVSLQLNNDSILVFAEKGRWFQSIVIK